MSNQFLSPVGDIENYFVSEYWLIDQYIGDELWMWGSNGSGRLGDNNTINRSTPVTTFAGGTNWRQISGGGYHTAAIKTDGTLWNWGFGDQVGLMGNGLLASFSTPVTTFAGGSNWKQVSCGYEFTMAIKTDGTLWGWGRSSNGQLGTGNFNTINSTPVTTFAGGTNWKQVSCGRFHTSAIKTDGTLWGWGLSSNGELGINPNASISTPVTTFAGGNDWKQVSSGGYHTSAIKTDGTLWIWGYGNVGVLGNANVTNRSTPITTFAGGNNWKQVSCGRYHTLAIKTDGTLWSWGWGQYGRLGNASIIDTNSTPVTTFAGGNNWKQVSCGGAHTTATKTDGTLWGWGRNNQGRLGTGDFDIKSTPVTTFAGGTNWKLVHSAGYHTVAVTTGISPDLPLS
jgi:alpha-tubulin suppressor-like RCC1 family protein